jgi:hypothetical protein
VRARVCVCCGGGGGVKFYFQKDWQADSMLHIVCGIINASPVATITRLCDNFERQALQDSRGENLR